MKLNFTSLLKTIVVLILGSLITFAGITASIYWLNTPLSFLNVLAFVIAYFIVLKPTIKYWAGFLVYLAEYKTIKAQMEQRKAVMEQIKNEMDKLKNAKEEDHERIAKEYKEKVDEIFTKMKENKAEEDK